MVPIVITNWLIRGSLGKRLRTAPRGALMTSIDVTVRLSVAVGEQEKKRNGHCGSLNPKIVAVGHWVGPLYAVHLEGKIADTLFGLCPDPSKRRPIIGQMAALCQSGATTVCHLPSPQAG